ncbi:MAG: polysaccharide biosynthesis tyrosine autokinase, partial [Planctomycetota bacterium]
VSYREKKQKSLQIELDVANKEKRGAEKGFRNSDLYKHLNPAGGDNPFQQQADAVAAVLNEKQIEQVLQAEEEERLRKVLLDEGFRVPEDEESEESEEGFRLRKLEGTGENGDLYRDLAENLTILALPAVQASENVKALRARLQLREDERSRLLERFTETSEEVREADRYVAAARRKLGAEVESTILRFLLAGQDLADVISTLGERVKDRQADAKTLNEAWAELADLQRKIAGLEERHATLERERMALLDLSTKERQSGPLAIENIRIERRARIQDTPMVHPNTMLIIVLTAFAALVLAFGSVFLVEFFDDTIKTKDDFDRYVKVPDLGFIPRISEKEYKRRDTAVLEKPRSSVAEAFRSLRTGILFSRRDEEIQCFLVSSAGPGEGKTTVATNLAITMAEAGRGKVLVIDADLRKARLHTALGIENGPGLTNCLVGSATLEETVRPTPIENLYALTSGPNPPNPAELLGGHRMAEILETARGEYGKIIIDTPPLVAVTDTSLLAPLVQGIFLVVSMGKTSWRLIERARQSLSAVGEEVTGGIVNDVRSSHRGYGYGYGYTYDRYYGKAEDAEE